MAKANLKNSVLKVNGAIIEDNKFSEITVAGNWVLKSAVVALPATDCVINLNSKDGTTVYYDDLMIRPLASSISGYVYNEWDELTYIIGNNGLASKYEYDKAGRLTRTYTEVVDDSENGITGGFKLTSSNTYNNRWLR